MALILFSKMSFVTLICLISMVVHISEAIAPTQPTHYSQPFNRSLFPPDIIFGAGTAAYQVEGAALLDGKGPSVWDIFTKKHPEKVSDGSTGEVAIDFYHRYKEDIQLMKKVGLDSFRFSISWPRVLPKGKLSGGVNPKGVQFYNNLINELLANGIKPFVTLFHWDTPQALDEEYLSWLSPNMVKDYYDYADFCFKTFGDRVKHWVTHNEPNGYTLNAYNYGTFAPGRCSNYVGNCSAGNSATEPYIVGHHLLLAHAHAVKLYRTKYQPTQKGIIGITIVTNWYIPFTRSTADIRAASRAIDFFYGWFVETVTFGHYPATMVATVGDRLPKFTKEESELLKGSLDFLGVNYYTTNYAKAALLTGSVNKSAETDRSTVFSTTKNGVPIGTPTALGWLYIYPRGFWEFLTHIKKYYNNPIIYVTENGLADSGKLGEKEGVLDSLRIRYHAGHLKYLLKAIQHGVRVKGYYVWAFWDDYEWDAGFTVRFGITYIDFKNNLKRTLKYSAYWFKMFLLR